MSHKESGPRGSFIGVELLHAQAKVEHLEAQLRQIRDKLITLEEELRLADVYIKAARETIKECFK